MWLRLYGTSTSHEEGIAKSMNDPYIEITEGPGHQATQEQLSMLYTRYHTAAGYAVGKDVLEVASGPGMGLGYMAKQASRVIAGDYSQNLLSLARHHYGDHFPLVRLDAQALPFTDTCFDVVLFYEAIYYLTGAERFVAEARRVLRPGGTLLICTANKDRPGFVRSPVSHRYFSAHDLQALLEEQGFTARLFGAFPVAEATVKDKVLSVARRVAVTFNLIPGTLKGREILKRLVYGRLHEFEPEVSEGMASLETLVPVPGLEPTDQHKVLYAIAQRP